MIRVGILDDVEKDGNVIKHIVQEYFTRKMLEFNVDVFMGSEILLIELKEKRYYNIFLLDMEMPGMSGLQVAKEIRKLYMEPFIIYVTDHVQHAPEAYEVNAFRYIPKAMLRDKLPEAFDSLIPKLIRLENKSYILNCNNILEKLLYHDIYYIKKAGKYITIYHRNGASKERKTLQEIFSELKGEEFIYVDKSYIVNIRHVSSCTKGQIRLRNDMILPVSRPRYKEVCEMIAEYWRKHE